MLPLRFVAPVLVEPIQFDALATDKTHEPVGAGADGRAATIEIRMLGALGGMF